MRDVHGLGCRDQLGTVSSNPAPPGQQTLWFHVVTSSLVLKHSEILDMLLHESPIAFINSACRSAAVFWPWLYQHSAMKTLKFFLFLLPLMCWSSWSWLTHIELAGVKVCRWEKHSTGSLQRF